MRSTFTKQGSVRLAGSRGTAATRQPGKPFDAKCRQNGVAVDRRRKAVEGFERLAREMNVSRSTVLRAYDFANRDEAAAVARDGRKLATPP